MSFIEKLKLRKIKKLQDANNSEKTIEKYLRDDNRIIKMAAVEALEYIATDCATDILINNFDLIDGRYGISGTVRILKALGKINSQKSIRFIKQVYTNHKYTNHPDFSEFAKIAKQILNKNGDPEVIIDRIFELDSKIRYNKTISDAKTIKTLCNKIKKHIIKEKHLISILSGTEIPEIANETLNKLTDLNINTIPYIKKIILTGVISRDILERINEPKLFVEIFDGYSLPSKEKRQLIISKLKKLKINYNINNEQANCYYCGGKGHFIDTEVLSEDQIYYGEKPKETKRKCDNCNGKGKIEFKRLQIIH